MLDSKHPEYKPLDDVQTVELPSGSVKVSEVIALLAKYHFDTKVKISVGEDK